MSHIRLILLSLATVLLISQNVTCIDQAYFDDFEKSLVAKETKVVESLKSQVKSLISQADQDFSQKEAQIQASNQSLAPEPVQVEGELAELKAKFTKEIENITQEITSKYQSQIAEESARLPSPESISDLMTKRQKCRATIEGTSDRDLMIFMSGKVDEIERQLAALQMRQKSTNEVIAIYKKNMQEEINVATYRIKSDFEGLSKQFGANKTIDPKKKQIGQAYMDIYVPVFQKIDALYIEAINKLYSFKQEYVQTKNEVYNVSNTNSCWTPFDTSIGQMNREREDYLGRQRCIETFWNVDLDFMFSLELPINHC